MQGQSVLRSGGEQQLMLAQHQIYDVQTPNKAIPIIQMFCYLDLFAVGWLTCWLQSGVLCGLTLEGAVRPNSFACSSPSASPSAKASFDSTSQLC